MPESQEGTGAGHRPPPGRRIRSKHHRHRLGDIMKTFAGFGDIAEAQPWQDITATKLSATNSEMALMPLGRIYPHEVS